MSIRLTFCLVPACDLLMQRLSCSFLNETTFSFANHVRGESKLHKLKVSYSLMHITQHFLCQSFRLTPIDK